MAYDFDYKNFAGTFSALDRSKHLPRLARLVRDLTDGDLPDAEVKRIAIRIAEDYLPMLRARIIQEQRS